MVNVRYLVPHIQKDLEKKMVFVGGPRQCGKTTMARAIGRSYEETEYLNWDYDPDRRRIRTMAWSQSADCLIFDELHKYPRWKNWIKGVYDVKPSAHRILVTGSARLDVYRRGGDSLLGRYHYWRLHPFTLSEVPRKMGAEVALKRLLTVGGFPEPFLDGDVHAAGRWRRERIDRIMRDDIRDLEQVQSIQTLLLFHDALRERVGSQVVLSNMAEELQVSPKTLKRWLSILEHMYVVFAVMPYTSRSLPRAIRKPPKVFFFDNGDVLGDEGAVFENLVATHLLKQIHFKEDQTGDRYGLFYLRDKEGHEVDFVITKNRKVEELIEVKWSDTTVSRSLLYFAEKLKPARGCRQIVRSLHGVKKGTYQGVRLQSAVDAFYEGNSGS
jgi:predicted AAA+ superfamily ATPase